MGRFFDVDAPIWAWMSEIGDLMILSFLWFLSCLGIVTIGAATTAVHYVLGKKVRKEPNYVFRDYIKSFKENFKQSLPLTVFFDFTLVSAFLYGMLVFDANATGNAKEMAFILPLAVVFAFEVISFFGYLWALLARFNMKTKQLMMTSFVLMHKHLLTTFVLLCVYVMMALLIFKMPYLMLVAPACIMFASSYLLQGIFNRYLISSSENQHINEEDAHTTGETL